MNSQYFSKEQVENGELNKLLDYLLSESYEAGDHYNDIHIYPESAGAFRIDWAQLNWNHSYGGCFEYIEEPKVVMIKVDYPDNSYDFAYDQDEANDMFNLWLHEHPEWTIDNLGHWHEVETSTETNYYENGMPQ